MGRLAQDACQGTGRQSGNLGAGMSTPHLLRPYTASQLSLVHGDERVVVFGVAGGRYAGPSVLVHLPTLRSRLDWLAPSVDTVVFIDEILPEPSTVSRIDDMLAVFPSVGAEALTQSLPATEALKQISDGVVERGVDRSAVFAVRGPEVTDRPTLTRGLEMASVEGWASPASLVGRAGGRIAFFEPTMVPDWLQPS